MKIRKFRAEGFRNIDSCEIDFRDGTNLIVGGNAQGKTNVIEGIYLFSRGRSFRTADDRELIGFGSEGFRISVEYEDEGGVSTLEYALFGRQRRRMKNGYKLSSAAEMLGSFRSVLFYPDDLRLVKGNPEERRSFLNVALSQTSPLYVSDYSRFKTALENRNALLKNASRGLYFDEGELCAWGDVMAEYSANIYIERKKYTEELSHFAEQHLLELSGGQEELKLSYKSDIESGTLSKDEAVAEYKEVYRRNLDRERAAGTSLFGPQRDDITVLLSGREARSFASQGQQRSIVLGMKLGEGEIIRKRFGEYPVFLLDDVLSELDDKRRTYLASKTDGMQTVITSCEGGERYLKNINVISAKGGTYVSSHR